MPTTAKVSSILSHWITKEEMRRLDRVNEDKKAQTGEMIKCLEKWGHLIEDNTLFRLCYLGELAYLQNHKTDEDMKLINFLYFNSWFLCPFMKFQGKFRQI